MYVNTSKFVDLINSPRVAQELVSELVEKFASDTARRRISEEAYWQHRSEQDVVRQTTSNLFRSFQTRKSV